LNPIGEELILVVDIAVHQLPLIINKRVDVSVKKDYDIPVHPNYFGKVI